MSARSDRRSATRRSLRRDIADAACGGEESPAVVADLPRAFAMRFVELVGQRQRIVVRWSCEPIYYRINGIVRGAVGNRTPVGKYTGSSPLIGLRSASAIQSSNFDSGCQSKIWPSSPPYPSAIDPSYTSSTAKRLRLASEQHTNAKAAPKLRAVTRKYRAAPRLRRVAQHLRAEAPKSRRRLSVTADSVTALCRMPGLLSPRHLIQDKVPIPSV